MAGLGRGIDLLDDSLSSCLSSDSHDEKYKVIDDFAFYCGKDLEAQSSNKHGSSGAQVNLCTNYFKVEKYPDFKFTHYRVEYSPNVEIKVIRKALIRNHANSLGGYIFDGGSDLFLTKELPEKTKEFESTTKEGTKVSIRLRLVKREVAVASQIGMHLLNLILRHAINELGLLEIRRNLFDPKNEIELPQFNLQLWPGYITSIREHEGGIMLCSEISHKVLRKDTVYDIFNSMRRDANSKEKFIRDVVGSIVMTTYNNKTYRVDDIDWNVNPKSTFKDKSGNERSLVEYYWERYKINIRDTNQPLLVSKVKAKEIRGGTTERQIFLIPELCLATGLTDHMRSDFQLMRELAKYTRMDPTSRTGRLMDFSGRLQKTPKCVEHFNKFQLKLQPEMIKLQGRQLNQEKMLFGNNFSTVNDKPANVDWTNSLRSNQMFTAIDLTRWVVIFPKRAENDTENFLQALIKAAAGMNYKMSPPKKIMLDDDRTSTYLTKMDEVIRQMPKFMMIIVPTAAADRYASIKKMACVSYAVPTQVVVQKTMQPKKGNMGNVLSVATKVIIQINCKLGGAPWMVEIPIKGLMTVGFDVSHDTSERMQSYGAFIATMDLRVSPTFFCGVTTQTKGDELSGSMGNLFRNALQEYFKTSGAYPEKIVFYRDSVGDGNINYVKEMEIKMLKEKFVEFYGSDTAKHPKFTFIVVSKRINTRFFKPVGRNQSENPFSGTVVDDTVTIKGRKDFYLISQSVRMGTVSPTSYQVIDDNSNFTTDQIQRLTYKLCHLYYNWCGTTRVPAVLQYAQKLGVFVGQYLHSTPKPSLGNILYFL